jgi:exosome complex RNA-binding protein Csl4
VIDEPIVPIPLIYDESAVTVAVDEDPGVVVLTCANCGAAMDERKCKLICRCGYFLSCSDYY